MPLAAIAQTAESHESSGGRLVTADGRTLPLRAASLIADARAGVVRVTLEQTFFNPHAEPLTVTYKLPLPAEGAVSGFAFRIGDQRIVGEVDTKKQARRRFEDAILEGKTAALLDQERSALFTQQVGNVPPRTEVVCEVTVDQKLAWLADGCWEWRFPTVVAPRYLGESGRVADSAKVTVDVADRALPVKLAMSLQVRDRLFDGARPESSSHSLHTARGLDRVDVTFADERGAGLDRDVVVRWRVAELKVGSTIDVARPTRDGIDGSAYGLVTLVPPAPEAKVTPVARDLIVLLDTSGSMSGEPLDQARRIVSALVDTLRDEDQLELIEFSWAPRRWKSGAVKASASNRKDAQAWLAKLRASGGTEMKAGILEALATLRENAQRQVLLITDGLIGSEDEVLEAIAKKLPRGCSVHTVGVGSAVNRSLTMPAARAGRGVELVVGLGEDVERSLERLLARTNLPYITEVEVTGSAVQAVSPRYVADLFGAAPSLISLKLDPRGGTVVVRGRSSAGPYEQRLEVKPMERGEGSGAVTALFAREYVEDCELALALGGNKRDFDAEIERAGLAYQISTRLTSWIAVSQQQTVDPRAPKRQATQPQQLPHGMSAEGLGLREARGGDVSASAPTLAGGADTAMRSRAQMKSPGPMAPAASAAPAGSGMRDEKARSERGIDAPEPLEEQAAQGEPEFSPPADRAADKSLSKDDEADGADEREFSEAGAPQDAPPEEESEAPSAPMRRSAMPGAPRKGGGLVNRIVDGLFGAGKPAQKQEEAKKEMVSSRARPAAPAPKPVVAASKAATERRTLKGRLISIRDGRVTIEIDVLELIHWTPEADATVELANGDTFKVKVDLTKTTAGGTYSPGLVLTLVLEARSSLPSPVARVTLVSDGELVEISL